MIYIIIKNKEGEELVRNEVTPEIPRDLLEYAASLTCESHNKEFPDDPWEPETIDTESKENS
jgi:hypothetical protein